MFRPKLLFTSLAALALGACSPQDPQAVTSAAIAKQVILPTYSRWVEADRQLAVSALAYCQGKESLDTRRLPARTKSLGRTAAAADRPAGRRQSRLASAVLAG
jgi:predicted lipoprotein